MTEDTLTCQPSQVRPHFEPAVWAVSRVSIPWRHLAARPDVSKDERPGFWVGCWV